MTRYVVKKFAVGHCSLSEAIAKVKKLNKWTPQPKLSIESKIFVDFALFLKTGWFSKTKCHQKKLIMTVWYFF